MDKSKDKLHPMSMEAYKQLFDTLYPPLCLFANKYLKDMERSQDVVQEVFVKVWEKKISYIHFNAIKSYLYTAVRNHCLNHLKSKYHKNVLQSPDVDFDTMQDEAFFLTQLTVIETYAQLEIAIKRLPHKSQRIIRLSLNAYTNKEIAEELSITTSTVRSQKQIAYEKLRQALGSLLNCF